MYFSFFFRWFANRFHFYEIKSIFTMDKSKIFNILHKSTVLGLVTLTTVAGIEVSFGFNNIIQRARARKKNAQEG